MPDTSLNADAAAGMVSAERVLQYTESRANRSFRYVLACQTQVEEGMYIATLPFFPLVKQIYDIEKIKPTEQIMMQLYPEIYACIGCNACTKSCTQGLNVMQYIAYAQRGEYEKCAEESFDCVMCGVCSSRCPRRNFSSAGCDARAQIKWKISCAEMRTS